MDRRTSVGDGSLKTAAIKPRSFPSPIRVLPSLPFGMEAALSNNRTVAGHGAAIPAGGSGRDAETGDAIGLTVPIRVCSGSFRDNDFEIGTRSVAGSIRSDRGHR